MNKLYKPDGTPTEVNDFSLKHALSIGWTKTDPTIKATVKVAKKPIKSTFKSTKKAK